MPNNQVNYYEDPGEELEAAVIDYLDGLVTRIGLIRETGWSGLGLYVTNLHDGGEVYRGHHEVESISVLNALEVYLGAESVGGLANKDDE